MTDNFSNKIDSFNQTSENIKTGDLKLISNFQKLKANKFFIVAVITTVVFALVGLMAIILNFSNKDVDYAVMYEKNGDVLLKANSFEADLDNNANGDAKITNDGKYLFYSVASSKEEGLFDIYFCPTRKKKSLQDGGEIAVSGVLKGFELSLDGEYLFYSKQSAGKSVLLAYDIRKAESEEISRDIDELFYSENAVFFIKLIDSKRVLMRYTPGQVAEQLDYFIKEARLYESHGESQLLYSTQKDSDDEVFTLKTVSDTGGIKKIADDVVKVNYDAYNCASNLYYFKKSEMNVSWRSIISDEKLSADSQLLEPVKDDYKIESLSFLGINAYDLVSYNEAVDEYNKKLQRDELRVQLEEKLTEEKLSFPTLTCYAYDGVVEHKLADSISADGIVSYLKKGEPKIVYKHVDFITSEEKPISIDDILDISESNGDDSAEYAVSIIKNSLTEPEYYLSTSSDSGGSISLNGSPVNKTDFSFYKDGSALITMVKDDVGEKSTLSIISITQYGVSEKRVIDTNVTKFLSTSNGIHYLKLDDDKDTGSLFLYNEDEIIKVDNRVLEIIDFEDDILYLCESSEQGADGCVDVYVSSEGESNLLSQGISISDILYTDSEHIAYIKNKKEGSKGDLYIYTADDKNELLDNDITAIMSVVV